VILSTEEFRKLKERDPIIFKKLYNRYKNHIYIYLNLKTGGNSLMAEELLSDVFHSALVCVPKLRNSKNLAGWLLQIANNRFYDYLRRSYREKKHREKLKEEIHLVKQEDTIEERIIRKERTLLLNMALENIKPEHKNIVIMKYLEERPVKEIASIIERSENAVLALLHRAKKSLKREIKRLAKDFN
jgi:RNA polymerase sigma-70 factor (ECF subfamily)